MKQITLVSILLLITLNSIGQYQETINEFSKQIPTNTTIRLRLYVPVTLMERKGEGFLIIPKNIQVITNNNITTTNSKWKRGEVVYGLFPAEENIKPSIITTTITTDNDTSITKTVIKNTENITRITINKMIVGSKNKLYVIGVYYYYFHPITTTNNNYNNSDSRYKLIYKNVVSGY